MAHFFSDLRSTQWMFFRAIICIVAGVLMMSFPITFIKSIIISIGILLALYGIIAFLSSHKKTVKDTATQAALVSGIVALILGIILILLPLVVSPTSFTQMFLNILPVAIIVGILLIGLAAMQFFEVNLLHQYAIKLSPFNYLVPLLLLVFGLLIIIKPSTIMNLMLIDRQPEHVEVAIIYICAIGLIYSGVTSFWYALRIHKASKVFFKKNNAIEEDPIDGKHE